MRGASLRTTHADDESTHAETVLHGRWQEKWGQSPLNPNRGQATILGDQDSKTGKQGLSAVFPIFATSI